MLRLPLRLVCKVTSDYYNGTTAPSWDELLAQFGMASEKRYTTTVKSADGYYTVYVKKK